ncbi:MAG: BamA/TamA family outer membrane protein [Candidatus Kapabacteria bacterium]|nr:BamA/TamA family outer membrane protein [Ignavibacteria bacterium]MBP6509616.1 BamA/TamA family outer membrane protein [Candidatus Kapabacteria bacterium]MBK6417584.1 BamA/TamA family outer membrane protein [Ignavibacteria bacterium]MBK6761444.1 BamA/TamA family outer membrane protein [Ignavibacteria bacterium]MBK7033466.1 BamA/TamA family outer membrane protein [Ignavibacteria bacterium]
MKSAVILVLMVVGATTVVGQDTDTLKNLPLLKKLGASEDLMDLVGLRSVEEEIRLTRLAMDTSAGAETPPLSLFLLPFIAANPNNGLMLGFGAQAGYYLGSAKDTRISSSQGSVSITTKDQTIITTQSTLFSSKDRWQFLIDWRYYDFTQSTYGLGSSSPEGSPVFGGFTINGIHTVPIPGEQPMAFDYLRLHQMALLQVHDDLYVGVGALFDFHLNIVDEDLDLDSTTPVVTSHYAYSKAFGFDPVKYSTAGLSLEAVYDKRDNSISPFYGPYARLALRQNLDAMGSSQTSTLGWAEFRTYISLDHILPRNVLGIWTYIHGVLAGNVPYLDLPALGYDFNGRSGRGYLQGRFRGTSLAYAEVEWRFPITRSGLLGAVVFGNFTSASRPAYDIYTEEKLFHRFRGAAGAGLRIMALKYSRTMIGIDMGYSSDGNTAIYFSVGDAF